MWTGIVTGCAISAIQLLRAFQLRHEPRPPHNRAKLPFGVLAFAGCVALAFAGITPVLFSILAVIAAVQIGLVLTGRNPWWMQSAFDRRQYVRYSAPPRDLEID